MPSSRSSIVFEWPASCFDAYIESCAYDEVTPLILQHLPKRGRILEGGCGTGRYVKYLSERGYDIAGVEYNQETVALVAHRYPHLPVYIGDVAHLPFPDGSFAGYVSLGVVEHFAAGPHQPLREMYRVLSPGGIAIISVPCMNRVRQIQASVLINAVRRFLVPRNSNLLRNLFGRPLRHYHARNQFPYHTRPEFGPFFEYLFSATEFEHILGEIGFTVHQIIPIYAKDGIKYDWGPCFARRINMKVHLTPFGKLVYALIGRKPFWTNHMTLFVAEKA